MPDGADVMQFPVGISQSAGREWINRGERFWQTLDVSKAEAAYKGTYIGDFCLRQKNGQWSDSPASVFYVEHPAKPEYSNYLGLFYHLPIWNDPDTRQLMVTDAKSVAEGHWQGAMATDGEIIYSRYRHDYRKSRDGTVMVDGGRDYFKTSLRGERTKTLRISVIRDKLVVNDTLFFPVRDA